MFLNKLVEMTKGVRVGRFDEKPEPFMGPVISVGAAQRLLDAQSDMIRRGARSLLEMKQIGDCRTMLSPGIIDVSNIDRSDVEYFGPLLQVIRVKDFDQAIREANNNTWGNYLVAGLGSLTCPGAKIVGMVAAMVGVSSSNSNLAFSGMRTASQSVFWFSSF